jgi:hypothetical protein
VDPDLVMGNRQLCHLDVRRAGGGDPLSRSGLPTLSLRHRL